MTSQLPALQFAVLTLIDGRTPGRTLRSELAAKYGIRRSGPGFYQLMARLETDGSVRGSYEHSLIDGQPIKERVYVRTAKGTKAVEATKVFYGATQ